MTRGQLQLFTENPERNLAMFTNLRQVVVSKFTY